MIKFTIVKDKKTIVGLGLSAKNIQHLESGKPIIIDVEKLGITDVSEIFIFAGLTEDSMAKDLAKYIGPNTKFNTDD